MSGLLVILGVLLEVFGLVCLLVALVAVALALAHRDDWLWVKVYGGIGVVCVLAGSAMVAFA